MQERVSKEEYIGWRGSKVTKQLVADLFEKRELLKEALAEGKTIDIVYIGQCQALKDAIDYIIEDFNYLGKDKDEDVETSITSDNR